MFTLKTQHAKENVTLQAETLEGIVKQVEEYAGPHTPDFSHDTLEGHIWWDDNETGFGYEGGSDAINVGGDPEEGEVPDYQHKGPKPLTVENIKEYAAYVLDSHPGNVAITES
ncbi:hypothetical protein ACN082_09855 [Rothia sp. CCM 9417]|uniref:hypothetical protein n=1 Tax=Rothia sp. CCM 9417 TaxID=3402657 RepID=UPI003AE98AE0